MQAVCLKLHPRPALRLMLALEPVQATGLSHPLLALLPAVFCRAPRGFNPKVRAWLCAGRSPPVRPCAMQPPREPLPGRSACASPDRPYSFLRKSGSRRIRRMSKRGSNPQKLHMEAGRAVLSDNLPNSKAARARGN